MGPDARLTPEQIVFVKEYLPAFDPGSSGVELAGQAGSSRYFVRIRPSSGDPVILVVWSALDDDWERFLRIPRELRNTVPFLPGIIGSCERRGLILEEDLGDETLHRYCDGRPEHHIEAAYRLVLDAVCQWQGIPRSKSPAIAARSMDEEIFLWETDYFARHCVVDLCAFPKLLDGQWERERRLLASKAAALEQCFIHRDFQSENVMVQGKNIRFVDFQGARLGPPDYDIASLLYDPYCPFLGGPLTLRLYSYYRSITGQQSSNERDFNVCAAQRLMQALGAYGNLSIHKGKPRYRRFVGVALSRLDSVFKNLPDFSRMAAVAASCLDNWKDD